MHVLLRERPPLFISFEYSGGWSTQLRKLAELKASQPAGGSARWGRSALGTDSSSLRDVASQLAQHNFLPSSSCTRRTLCVLMALGGTTSSSWCCSQRQPSAGVARSGCRAARATVARVARDLQRAAPAVHVPNQRLPACTAAPPLAMALGASCRCFSVWAEASEVHGGARGY